MPFDLYSSIDVLSGTALAALIVAGLRKITSLRELTWPKIEIKGHTEQHRGIRVMEIALIFSGSARNKRSTRTGRAGFELVVYVTLKL